MAHIDEVGKFWLVTYPRKNSEVIDICFETDVIGLVRQVLGGLSEDEIAVAYQSKEAAHLCTTRLLNASPRNKLISQRRSHANKPSDTAKN